MGPPPNATYIRAVKSLSEFLGRSPATAEDLRRFQLHQSAAGAQPPVMNNTVRALRFFFRVTLDRPEMARHLTLVRQPRKVPSVLNEEEVVRLLENANGLKYRAAVGVTYGAGLRVSEVAHLKVSDRALLGHPYHKKPTNPAQDGWPREQLAPAIGLLSPVAFAP